MALHLSGDGGNTSSLTNSSGTISDGNLSGDPPNNSVPQNNTLHDLGANHILVEDPTSNQTLTLSPNAFDSSLNVTTATNLTNLSTSLMNSSATQALTSSNDSLVLATTTANLTNNVTDFINLNATQALTSSNNSLASNGSLVSSDAWLTQSSMPRVINPKVMGEARLDGAIWQAPGVIIGIGCLVLGLSCLIIGIFLRIRAKRSSNSTRRLRVVSGFDFNDRGEDDDHHNLWHKEKSGLDLDDPLPVLNSFRFSLATVFSTDDEENESNKNSRPPFRFATGFAQ